MKKFFTLAFCAIFAISVSAKRTSTSQFSSIRVDAPVHLVIIKGHSFSVNVASRNTELESAIKWTIKDGVLRLSTKDLESIEASNSPVHVIITAPIDVEYKVGKDLKEKVIRHKK